MKKNEVMEGRLLRGKGKVGRDPTTQVTPNEMNDANFLGRVIRFWRNDYSPRSKPSFSFVAFVMEILSKEEDIVLSNCLEFILPSSVNRFYPEMMVFLDDFDRPTVIAYGYLSSYSSAASVCSVVRPYTSELTSDEFIPWWVLDKSSPSMRVGVEEHIVCYDDIFKYPDYRITINPNLKQRNILITIPELYVFCILRIFRDVLENYWDVLFTHLDWEYSPLGGIYTLEVCH